MVLFLFNLITKSSATDLTVTELFLFLKITSRPTVNGSLFPNLLFPVGYKRASKAAFSWAIFSLSRAACCLTVSTTFSGAFEIKP